MTIMLQTERLFLRPLVLDDATFILELVNSPGWLQYIGDRKIHSLEDAEGYIINGPLKSYATHGFGLWCVVDKQNGIPIGMCGLLKRDYLDHPDLGYAILPAYEGQGYVTEIAQSTLDYAAENLHIDTILAITNADHHRSIRVLEKNGFTFERFLEMPGENKVLRLFQRRLKSR